MVSRAQDGERNVFGRVGMGTVGILDQVRTRITDPARAPSSRRLFASSSSPFLQAIPSYKRRRLQRSAPPPSFHSSMARPSPLVYYHFILYGASLCFLSARVGLRLVVLAVIIVSSAIISSVAAWNLSLLPRGSFASVDAYMIFLGAFSLLVVFPMFFLDLLTTSPYTSTVRIECLWVGILLLFQFPGAVASSALLSDMCNPSVPGIVDTLGACRSSRLLQAFAWICTINLLLYFVSLTASAALYARTDSSVWTEHVCRVDWRVTFMCRLRSAPPSPARPRFNTDIMVAAPQPHRPYIPRSPTPLGERYRIEHLSETIPGDVHSRTHDAASRDIYVPQRAVKPVGAADQALYPAHIRAAVAPPPPQEHTFPPPTPRQSSSRRKRSRSRSTPIAPKKRSSDEMPLHPPQQPATSGAREMRRQKPTPPQTPSPIGEWPRRDIISNPPPPRQSRARAQSASSRPLPTHAASAPTVQQIASLPAEWRPAPVSPAPPSGHTSVPSSAPSLIPAPTTGRNAPSAFPPSLSRPRRPAGPRASFDGQSRASLELGLPATS
ncbi:hypothetical protein K488DRAFT_82753 [Vararia minispora EC-137]|uniref:Uncharacterized protein n=1 Tax=Vararia minispora EC-137 TaxID=1314806 RepID=A0ACB8QW87_9AGAM|nr:hypothetical protein K488DRAFT_82753 [Vararia minispora EC-137]